MAATEPYAAGSRTKKLSRLRVREALTAALYILPAFVVLAVFRLYPFANAFYISLHRWGILEEAYVGLKNYVTLFSDKAFGQSLLVTVFYVLATVPFAMALALLIAYLLFQKIRFRSVFRTLYFLPYITSLVPAAMAWEYIRVVAQ